MMNNLPEAVFLLCKRSAILNVYHFKSFEKNPPMIEMANGEQFKLSKRNAIDFRLMIETMPDISNPYPFDNSGKA